MPKQKKKANRLLPLPFVNPDMKAIREAAKEHKSSFAYRHELLKHHQRINFKNEYDRIRGILDHGNLPASSIKLLNDRKSNLKDMIKSNLYPIRSYDKDSL